MKPNRWARMVVETAAGNARYRAAFDAAEGRKRALVVHAASAAALEQGLLTFGYGTAAEYSLRPRALGPSTTTCSEGAFSWMPDDVRATGNSLRPVPVRQQRKG